MSAYYVTNLQGDVVAILDSTGAMVVNYHYDAYGVLLQTGGTMAATLGTLNPLTYRGYVYDHETGLYYLQSRYYNPTIRQFISADAFLSTGQGFMGYNMFAYCGNNPVNFKDPTGEIAVTTVILIAAGVAALVAGGCTAYATYEQTGQVDWGTTALVTACTFVTVYSGSMYLYGLYGTYCTYYGYTAITNIGSTPTVVANANANSSTNMQHIAEKGRTGEALSGVVKNTAHIKSLTGTASYRIPDGLDADMKVLSEVKNYAGTLSYTNQLKDFVMWSQANGYKMHLYTNAVLTGPLQQLVDSEVIQLFPLK